MVANEQRDEHLDRTEEQKTEEQQRRERALDKTIADSFPTSDPPSTIPDPGEEEDAA
jgi:hypothetical protein